MINSRATRYFRAAIFRSFVLPVGVCLLGLLVGAAHTSGQERTDTGQVTITGTVLDLTTLDPILGVEVRLPDLGLADESDSFGGFGFEVIPLGIHEMVLDKEGYIQVRGPLAVAEGGSFVVYLRSDGSPEPGSLAGLVFDPSSGASVETAMLTLRGTHLQRMTNADGLFAFAEVPPGQHVLEVEHIGYRSRSDSVRVVAGRNTEIEIPLAVRPIEMEPITITARSKWMVNNGFFRRTAGDYSGEQWTAEEIQESGVTHLGDLLEQVEGIRMVWQGTRGLSILSNQPRQLSLGGWCRMPLYIDGIWMEKIDLDMVIPSQAEGLEVYHGVNAPLEYSHGFPCGVILVWTR